MSKGNDKTAIRDQKTRVKTTAVRSQTQSMNVLPIGTYLGEFEILALIGEGGFGIVYLAYDHTLERRVALKEYMPSGLATRTSKMAVTVRSQRNNDTFVAGLKSFVNEARLLAQFDSPALVKVYRFWEGNGTAYMVMPYYEGVTLKQALKQGLLNPSENWIRMLLADLFDAIETIHRAQCFHRDIAPDNILLLKDGRPLLLDFGAARRVIGDLTQCLTVILKPGYAPIEQYADIAGLRQGAWTDIYAIAAVVYYLITGMAPPPAVARMVHDEMVPAVKAGKGRYSARFLNALDKALSVKPEYRFRSIAELRQALDSVETAPRTLPQTESRRMPAGDETLPLGEAPLPVMHNIKPGSSPGAMPMTGAVMPPGSEAQMQRDKKEPYLGSQSLHEKQTYANPDLQFAQQAGVSRTMNPSGDTRAESTIFVAHAIHADKGSQAFEPRRHKVPPRRASAWLATGLLFCTGVAAGSYWGTSSMWNSMPERLLAAFDLNTAKRLPESDTAANQQPAEPIAGAAMESTTVMTALPSRPVSPPVAHSLTEPPARPVPGKGAALTAGNNTDAKKNESSPAAPLATHALPEDELWQKARASGKPSVYGQYLKEYPEGRHAAAARHVLEEKPSAATSGVSSGNRSPSSSQDNLGLAEPSIASAPAWPKGMAGTSNNAPGRPKHTVDSRNATASSEAELWRMAKTLNQPTAYEAYLHQYPRGLYAGLAKDKLASFRKTESQTAPPTATAPQAVQTTAHERRVTEDPPRLASIKPSDSSGASPAPAPDVQDTMLQRVPEPRTTSDIKTLKLSTQTMIGNFTTDPKTGIVSGSGKIIWNNGNQFEGTLMQGVKEGKGQFIWNNGQRYTGDWARDLPNGKGTIVFADGNRYTGEVKDGVPHGQGVIRFRHGDVYSGAWAHGKSHGHGRYAWANGSYWEGEFRDDKRTENGRLVMADRTDGGSTKISAPAMVESKDASSTATAQEQTAR